MASLASSKNCKVMDVQWHITDTWHMMTRKIGSPSTTKWNDLGLLTDLLDTVQNHDKEVTDHGIAWSVNDEERRYFTNVTTYAAAYKGRHHPESFRSLFCLVKRSSTETELANVTGTL